MSTDWFDIMRRAANAPTKSHRRPQRDEDKLQIACKTWFDAQFPKLRLLLHHSPNEGLLVNKASDGAKRKAMGVRAGFPDFIFLYPSKGVPYLCIELKTSKGKQSDSQKEYQHIVESVGARYCIIRSLEEFIETIKDYINE